jgi:hypothetical protein
MDEAQAWRELAACFSELSQRDEHRLYAVWSPIIAPAGDEWYLSGTSDEGTHQSFRAYVDRASALQKRPPNASPLSWWLEMVKLHTHRYQGGYVVSRGGTDGEPGEYTEHGTIRSLCLASAECCYKFETDAIAQRGREGPISPVFVASAAASQDEQPHEEISERSALIEGFKAIARQGGVRVTDKMIAAEANPGRWNDRTIVAWWKRNDKRSTPGHDKRIRAVLARDPLLIWPKR